jgi:voltage-gated potassium channel
MKSTIKFRLVFFAVILIIILTVGVAGFMKFEDLSPFEALYFTVVTISTVGYGDIHPSTLQGSILAIVLIVIGVGTFLGIIATITEFLMHRREDKVRKQRLNVITGIFFSEIGTQLIQLFTSYDPDIGTFRRKFAIDNEWSDQDFLNLYRELGKHNYTIDPKSMDLKPLSTLLKEKGDLLHRLFENPNLMEHEAFTELLRTILHLREELIARENFTELPDTDLDHLANDAKRIYTILGKQWLNYMHYLKSTYPYLFSLALRTNPFKEKPSAIVT